MIKYIFKSATGSFSRTIGRILAYILIGFLLMLIASKFNLMQVNAATWTGANLNFLGYKLDDEFSLPAKGSKTGNIAFNTTGWSKHDGGAFAYVDICTTGNMPTLWITNNIKGSMSPSTKWYKVNMACNTGGYKADVYRQIIYISDSSYEMGLGQGMAEEGNVATAVTYNHSTGQLFSNSDYTTYMRILHFGVTDSIPLDDIAYDNDLTQTQVLKDILEVLQNSNNNDVTSAINNQTQKIEEQIQKQEETNQAIKDTNNTIKDDKVDGAQGSANSFFKDFEDKDYGLTGVITMPLTFINKITSGTCTPLSFPAPFVDQDITLPCMYDIYQTYFGDFLTIYQTITFGVVSYWVCINIFHMVKNFKNPDNDEIEVLDL